MICDDEPRQVRFGCGHSCCCYGCFDDLREFAQRHAAIAADERRSPQEREEAAKKAIAQCPTCRKPIDDVVVESGAQVGDAPTFVLPAAVRPQARR